MSEQTLCPTCGRVPIEGCDLQGHIPVGEEDGTNRPCPNILLKRIAKRIDPEFGHVTGTRTPLLLLNPQGGEPVADYTCQNIVITCPWRGLLPHLKYVLSSKLATTNLNFRWLITTDERIRSVFVGSESYKARKHLEGEDSGNTVENVSDLVGSYDLVIIRLGYLGYRNQAAAGALKEALLHRDSIHRFTWIVEDPDRPWKHSRGPVVEQYIKDNFGQLAVEPVFAATKPPPADLTEPTFADAPDDPSDINEDAAARLEWLTEETKGKHRPKVRRESRPEESSFEPSEDSSEDTPADTPSVDPDVISMPGDDQPERKSYGRRSR